MPENTDSAAAGADPSVPPNGCGYAPRKMRGPAKNSAAQKIDKNSKSENKENSSAAQVLDTSLASSGNSSLSSAIKTPVSILQELLSRRGITPNYELVQIEGAIHEPTFRYRVSFNDKEISLTAMGSGRSKKEAKHAAAKALIDKLTGVSVVERTTVSNDSKSGVSSGFE
uniref:DRBM domain-containing protein n=1 Tax=Megaselia scalaris TaxID=36166 RepID=T1GW90_MEGSC